MLGGGTDRDWEAFGKLDPYWAVVTHETYRGLAVSDAEKLDAFLDSGRQYVARIWDVIESHLGGRFTPTNALDFGCGVGRVAIPLAERCGLVVGVDVAESMLAEARALCAQRNLTNVRFAKCDDSLAGVQGTFDLVHSYIVFQHIPQERGLRLLRQLIGRLNDYGVGVLHVLYFNPDMDSGVPWLLKSAWRRLKRPFRRVPRMQMNAYSLNALFRIIHSAGIRQIHVLTTDHGGCLGVVVCFRKVPNASYLA